MNTRIRSFLIPFLLTSIAFCAGAAPAPALTPFGKDGRVITAFPSGGARALAITHDQQGRLILAGIASALGAEDLALARYLANGALDPSFGITGRVTTDLGGVERVNDVAIDSQGRILVAGSSCAHDFTDTPRALVARYLPDGTLDSGFGKGGIARVDSEQPHEYGEARTLAIDSADRVVVGGQGATRLSDKDPADGRDEFDNWILWRLSSDGVLDPSFGGGGFAQFQRAGENDAAADVALDSAGRILIAIDSGNVDSLSDSEPLVVNRLTPDGMPDNSFGDSGLRSVDVPSGLPQTRAVAVDGRDRIVLAGEGSGGWYVTRMWSDGRLDRSFASNGRASISVKLDLGAIAIDSRNRVVLGSRAFWAVLGFESRLASRFPLVRLRGDGSRDRSFAREGLTRIGFGRGSGSGFRSAAGGLTIVGDTVYVAGTTTSRAEPVPPMRFAITAYAGLR